MARETRLDINGETEMQCSICKDWWPMDREFFEVRDTRTGKLAAHCKACGIEMRRRLALKPCNVPGCDQPRYGRVSAFCRDHHYIFTLNRQPPPKRTTAKEAL